PAPTRPTGGGRAVRVLPGTPPMASLGLEGGHLRFQRREGGRLGDDASVLLAYLGVQGGELGRWVGRWFPCGARAYTVHQCPRRARWSVPLHRAPSIAQGAGGVNGADAPERTIGLAPAAASGWAPLGVVSGAGHPGPWARPARPGPAGSP